MTDFLREQAIVVVMENRFTPVATRYPVVNGTGKLKTEIAGHAALLVHPALQSVFNVLRFPIDDC